MTKRFNPLILPFFPHFQQNNSTGTQSATPNRILLPTDTITGKTLNDKHDSSTHMVRHNFHTVNHGEGIIRRKWFIPYITEVNVLKIKVKYHTHKNKYNNQSE